MVALAGSLLLAACGDDDSDDGEAAGVTAVDQDATGGDEDSGASDEGDDGAECSIGVCVDELTDELSAIPMPDSVDEIAESFDAPDRYSQDAYFNVPFSELVDFYETELPAAGFEITQSNGSGDTHTIEFVDPDGRNGSLFIRTAASHESQVGYEIFKS